MNNNEFKLYPLRYYLAFFILLCPELTKFPFVMVLSQLSLSVLFALAY